VSRRSTGARRLRRASVAAITISLVALPLAVVAAGCGGDGDALVGGDCASGYAPCGNDCCPVAADGASATDGTTLADGSDGSPFFDGNAADRFGPGHDGASDAPPDGSPAESGSSDAADAGGSGSDGGDGGDGGGATATDGASDVAETGPLCTPPLVDCGGVCVDTTSDPLNCGQCGLVCPSQICSMSLCVGSTAGGIVFIGHDYLTTPAGTAQARVLTNAAFIPQNDPLAILSFEHYASAAAVARVNAILSGAATQVGRQLKITSTSTDSDIPSKLVFATYQVLLVEDQVTASPGALKMLGTSWAPTLATFTQAGGIVIVLDGGTGTAEMDAFSTGTGLLSVTGQSTVTGTFLLDVAPGDVVGVNVVSPYSAGTNSVSVTTEPRGGSVAYVIAQQTDAGPGAPVVVHKVF
jgi:hypothetical protein